MSTMHVRGITAGALLVGALASGCGGDAATKSPVASDDERGNVGPANPASEYCAALGYTHGPSGACGDASASSCGASVCRFPDGTSCEEWALYRGQCGNDRSYCASKGGTIATKTEERNGGTYVYATCTLSGKTCLEDSFFRTGKCE